MTHWTDAGFGTDPEGDTARRAELEVARIDPAALRAAHERIEDEAPYADVPAGYYVREDPDYGEVLVPIPEPVEPGPHEVRRVEYPWGVAWTCACGRWEAVATGPSSAGWAGADHARHVRDEEAGARAE